MKLIEIQNENEFFDLLKQDLNSVNFYGSFSKYHLDEYFRNNEKTSLGNAIEYLRSKFVQIGFDRLGTSETSHANLNSHDPIFYYAVRFRNYDPHIEIIAESESKTTGIEEFIIKYKYNSITNEITKI